MSEWPMIFRIPNPTAGQLSTMPRPRGGDSLDDEMAALREKGIDVIVSLQTHAERAGQELTDEGPAARRHGMEFHHLPIDDLGVPGHSEVEPLVAVISEALSDGRHVAIHCRAGIGRSSLIAGAVLIRHGVRPTDACTTISTARGRDVPETDEQRAWLAARAER